MCASRCAPNAGTARRSGDMMGAPDAPQPWTVTRQPRPIRAAVNGVESAVASAAPRVSSPPQAERRPAATAGRAPDGAAGGLNRPADARPF